MTAPTTTPRAFEVHTGRVTNWPVVVASAIAMVPVLLLARAPRDGSDLLVVLVLALVGVVGYALTGSSVRTSAGPAGVIVHLGLVGWPRARYPLARIRSAQVVDVPLWSVAGGFWWSPRRTSYTVRSGPSLRLTLDDGRRVTVSTPRPEEFVAALRAAGRPS